MNTELARFILSTKNDGFSVGAEDIKKLIAIDRLCLLLWRCGSCRFLASAQYYGSMLAMVEAVGDYVRDISFPSNLVDEAASFMHEISKLS